MITPQDLVCGMFSSAFLRDPSANDVEAVAVCFGV